MNLYTTLGLDPARSSEELQRILTDHYAAREAAGFLPGESEKILVARAILGDPVRRGCYNQALASGNAELVAPEQLKALAATDPQLLGASGGGQPTHQAAGQRPVQPGVPGANPVRPGAPMAPGQPSPQPPRNPVAPGQPATPSFGAPGTTGAYSSWEPQKKESGWPLAASKRYQSQLWLVMWVVALVFLVMMYIIALVMRPDQYDVGNSIAKLEVSVFAIPGIILMVNELIWALRRNAAK